MVSKKQRNFLCAIFTGCCISISATGNQPPLDHPINREILDNYRKKSDEYVAKNLNRFAIERLQVYDKLLDSLYIKEKSDTLALIESIYKSNAADMLTSIQALKKDIAVQSKSKAELESRYWSLVKYAVFAFIVWLGLAILFIRFRMGKVKKATKVFDDSSSQLETMEGLSGKAEKLFTDLTSKKLQIKNLDEEVIKLESKIATHHQDPTVDASKAFITHVAKLRKSVDAEKKIIESLMSQSESTDEKETVDINSICDAYMEIAMRGFDVSESFNCEVSRDFEKKLPGLQMNPSAVGILLLNVLSNAFESVKEKNEMGIKGYKPKISISTRILPKFLQVRIKDNGTGMNEQLLQSAGKEFFTTRTITPRPGLGLSIAKSIVEEHKGEIKIESEEGNSTDVYIKFYLK